MISCKICIKDALESVKIAGEKISSRQSNLLEADNILRWMINDLDSQVNPIACKLITNLVGRIGRRRRRNDLIVSILRFLKNPKIYDEKFDDYHGLFQLSEKSLVISEATNIFKRLYPDEADTEVVSDSDNHENNGNMADLSSMSKSERCSHFLASQDKSMQSDTKLEFTLSDEFHLFQKTFEKTRRLKLLEDALLTLKPTSVESERIFSNVGRIATKYRMNLTDNNLNALVVLRAYYLNEIRNKI